jgi:APA family basic amino acid/polyamine antiporter
MLTTDAPAQGLARAIGVRALAASIFNMTVGAGIFALPAVVAADLGPAAPLAYGVCAAMMALVVLCFAETGSRVVGAGGAFAYSSRAFGPCVGFVIGVLLYLGSQLLASASVAAVLAGTLGDAVPAMRSGMGRACGLIVVFGIIAFVNSRSVRSGTRLIQRITVAKVAPLIALICSGIWFIHPVNLLWPRVPSASSIGRSAVVLVFAFTGMECALATSGEVATPARTVPRAIAVGLVVTTTLYLLLQLVSQGVLGADLPRHPGAPLAAVAEALAGAPGRAIMLGAASVSALGYICADVLSSPRSLFALARDGMLPAPLARVHPRFRSPHVAIWTHAALACGLAIAGTFRQLAALSSVATLCVYEVCCLATIELRRRRIQDAGRPFLIPGGYLVPLLALGVVLWLLISARQAEIVALAITVSVALAGYGGVALVRRLRTVTQTRGEWP